MGRVDVQDRRRGAKRRDDERAEEARLGLGGRERQDASDWPVSQKSTWLGSRDV